MKLKGEMVIELTDTNTGAVETVQETNMITDTCFDGDEGLELCLTTRFRETDAMV